ncbi:MAG: AhpC/TSA family protein [Proteobacteria bacterium]|nr:MAG: AhpC/TSA family protein [Pseudomonadota bacterium]
MSSPKPLAMLEKRGKTRALQNVPNGGPTIMDSATLKKDGGFELKAPSKEEVLYQLRLSGKTTPFAFFINDVQKVKVNADLNNPTQPYTVEGSAASQALIDFDKSTYEKGMQIYSLGMRVDSLNKAKASDSLITVEYQKLEVIAASLKASAQEAIQKSNSPVLTLYTLGSYQNTANNLSLQGFSQEEIAGIINKAATKFPNHTAIQTVKKNISAPVAQKPAAGVRKAPEFVQPDVNGKPISLASFKGKYVLLDFWASWCKPCRMENPNVVKAYNEFKDKNFTVLGVSLDQEKNAWQEAIKKDGLTWTHASDLKFWSNEAAALYEVQSIPANFLIDPSGNIIAQDLRGEDLTETLRKHLK